MKARSKPLRIAVINGACVARDAISESVRGSLMVFQEQLGAEVCLYTYANEFPGYPVKIVTGVHDILLDEFYLEADIILYHFGIAYEMFGALLLGNGKAKQIVRYHNVTPKAFLPASAHALANKSLRQISLANEADMILADSAFNKADLVEMGIAADRIDVVPLYVKFDTPRRLRPTEDARRTLRLLYVGRFVESKGVIDLIEALGRLNAEKELDFSLTMAGNVDFSDPAYIRRIQSALSTFGIEDKVTLEPNVTDDRLHELYETADLFVMPSYHEGFCVPILEAFHAGCVPVSSTAGNLPSLVGKLGVTYAPGDVDALTSALKRLSAQFERGRPDTLRLGRTTLTWEAYERAVGETLENYRFEVFAGRMADAVRSLLGPATPKDAKTGAKTIRSAPPRNRAAPAPGV